MLVLTRRLGESIKIGDDIEVKVVKIQGKQVRLSFDAPKDISINRTEVLETEKHLTESEKEDF